MADRSSPDAHHSFDDRRDAIRYMVAQLVEAGSLVGFGVFILCLIYFQVPVWLGTLVMLAVWAGWGWSIWTIGRSPSYPRGPSWPSRDVAAARATAWHFSRKLFKDAAVVADWPRGWVVARDLAWTVLVALMVTIAVVGGVTIRT